MTNEETRADAAPRRTAAPDRLGCSLGLVLATAAVASFFGSFVRPALGLPALALSLGLLALLMRAWKRREREVEDSERARLASVAAPVGDAWRALLEAEGLAKHVAALAPLVRPAVRLEATPAAELPLGASRIGGSPDLPPAFAWPRWREKPLAFLAQIDLAQAGGAPLPRSGHLCFFHAADQDAWGFDPKSRGASVVVHFPAGTELVRAEPPDELDEAARFHPCALRLVRYDDLPELDEGPLERVLGDEESDRYHEVRSFLASGGAERASHKLLGHPQLIQGAMELECQLVTNGIDCGGPAGYRDPRAEGLAAGSADWRLLLQLDSDDAADMTWGDAGRLYFWIRAQDLAALRFERAWMILQCH